MSTSSPELQEDPEFREDIDLTVFDDISRQGATIQEAIRVATMRAEVAEDRADLLQGRLRDKVLLLGTFEHALKTSFTVIAGWARTLDEDWERLSDDQRRLGLATMRRRAEETVAHAQDLLDDVAAEIHGLDLRPVRIDLAEVLSYAAVSHGAVARDHAVRYEGPDRLPLTVDPAALQQILGQLLENATKYSPVGTTITLSARSGAGGQVCLEVRDEGCGIPPDVALFQPFVRGPQSASTTRGSGLGLYIVQNLVHGLGGSVTASRNPEGGSTFTVTLPGGDESADVPLGD